MIICGIICFTFIICFCITARIYYIMKINKDFKVKADDIRDINRKFIEFYIERNYTDKTKSKFNGKPIDIINLLETINEILYKLK